MQFFKTVRQLYLKDGTIRLYEPRKNPCPGLCKLPATSITAQYSSLAQSILKAKLSFDCALTIPSSRESLFVPLYSLLADSKLLINNLFKP